MKSRVGQPMKRLANGMASGVKNVAEGIGIAGEDGGDPPPEHAATKSIARKLADMRTTLGETAEQHKEEVSHMLTPGGWLSPSAKWRMKWDLLQGIILIYLAIAVPIAVGFDEPTEGTLYVFDLFVDLFFWIDIVFNFFFAYENSQGLVEYDMRKIRMHYLKGWFSIDLVASLPVDLVMRIYVGQFTCSLSATCKVTTNVNARMIRLVKLIRVLRLMKMLRLIRISRLLSRYQDEFFHIMHYIKLAKLLSVLLFLGHIFGCFFYFFSTADWRSQREKEQIENGMFEGWVEQNGLEVGGSASLSEKYSVASYWAFTTMTTVGYGDISASTNAERTWAIFGMLVGGFIFSTMVGSVTSLIDNHDLSKQAYDDKMNLVGAFVKDYRLPEELRLRVLRFFRRQDVRAYDEQQLLNQMPFKERDDLLWYSYGALITSVPMFRNADRAFLSEVMNTLVPTNLQPGHMVVLHGEALTHMYLVATGAVELLCDDGSRVFRVLHAGSYFGEHAVFQREASTHFCSVRVAADSNAKLLRLPGEVMELALQRHPDLRVRMVKEFEKRAKVFEKAKCEVEQGTQRPKNQERAHGAYEQLAFSHVLDDVFSKTRTGKMQIMSAQVTPKSSTSVTSTPIVPVTGDEDEVEDEDEDKDEDEAAEGGAEQSSESVQTDESDLQWTAAMGRVKMMQRRGSTQRIDIHDPGFEPVNRVDLSAMEARLQANLERHIDAKIDASFKRLTEHLNRKLNLAACTTQAQGNPLPGGVEQ